MAAARDHSPLPLCRLRFFQEGMRGAMSLFAATVRALTIAAAALFAISATAAIDPQTIRDLAFGESDAKIKAIGTLASRGPADGRRVAIRAECFARPSG